MKVSPKAVLVGVTGVLLVLVAVTVARPRGRHVPAKRAPHASARHPQTRHRVIDHSVPWEVERAFVRSYVAWLDGRGHRLTDAGLTARAELCQAGRLPSRFADGQIRVRSLGRLAVTLYSGQAIVVLANREQTIPFTIELLREPGGWAVEQVTPPDFTSEVALPRTSISTTPLAASRAARSFADRYVALRARNNTQPPVGGKAIGRALLAFTDPLARTELSNRAAVQRIVFGPVIDGELAATATISTGQGHAKFSFLMRKVRRRGWVCTAFL
jgi:hypothetical protein